jgi:4-diphosphocytidyl-2-C-methyl-D-erythritol kinase
MQAISLCDTLVFEAARPGEFSLRGGNEDAPPTEGNLVLKAARALNAATDGTHGADVTLEKRIPVGAGLGGGSSDAAATLLGLNDLWGTGLSREDLAEIAAGIGSDVPFFLGTGTALVEGRGERLTALAAPPVLWLALAKPTASLATVTVYGEYPHGPVPFGLGDATRVLATTLRVPRNAEETFQKVVRGLHNDLQPAAIRLCPEIAAIQARMAGNRALGTLVCGSGSAVFGIADNEEHARRMAEAAGPAAAWTAVARTISLPNDAQEAQP